MLQEAKRFIGNVRDFYGDQSRWQEHVKEADTDTLLKEINRNKRKANIEENIGYYSFMGGFIGMSVSAMFLNADLARGLVISTLAAGLIHLPTKAAFQRRTEFIDTEVASRREQAVFYQDAATLVALEGSPL